MDATCTIQDSIHVFNLVHKYVSRILGTYHIPRDFLSVHVLSYSILALHSTDYTRDLMMATTASTALMIHHTDQITRSE